MDNVKTLEKDKKELLEQICQLGDMRQGSVVEQYVEVTLKDGSATRRGPYFLYTYKSKGKTISRRLDSAELVDNYRRQIEQFRKFEKLRNELVEVSRKICDCGIYEAVEDRDQKKLRKRSSRKSGVKSKG